MKAQLFASAALRLLSAIPGTLSPKHHSKQAVVATVVESEDFKDSFSLRGASAAAPEDASD
eukprot:scaffold19398_cov76-Skeletonema_dohrnii-CCMP3373.AAC.4